VAWGYATAASNLGVDIVEHSEVTGSCAAAGAASRASRPRGDDPREQDALVAAGHTSVLAAMVGLACRSSRIRCRRW
jgi:sarcosine oxidase subunit beta